MSDLLPQPLRHPWMDEATELFRTQVRRAIEAHLTPHLDDWRRQGFIPRSAWQPFGELGFLLPELPEAYGGAEASIAYQYIVQDEMTRAEVPSVLAVHTIAAHYLLAYGTEAQKQRWLPGMADGTWLAGIAMTEPGCGSDLKAIRTRARREGEHYMVDGAKTFITNGYTANLLVIVVRTGETGSRGLSLLMVETEGQEGFRVGRRLEKLGQHASDTAELFFDHMRVPADQLLGEAEGQAFGQLMSQLIYERLLIAVPAAAVMEQAVRLTAQYTRDRQAFGQAIADFQNTRFVLAECATLAHLARSYVNDCIQRQLDGTLEPEAAYMAKWWCTEQQGIVTDRCLQLFGGYGYMQEYPIARLYADARVQRIYGGTNEIMKELIARKVLA